MDRGVLALRKNPLAILAVRKSVIKQDHGSAVPAAEPQVALIPRSLFEPAQIWLANLHRGTAASANNLLRPIGPDGNDLHI